MSPADNEAPELRRVLHLAVDACLAADDALTRQDAEALDRATQARKLVVRVVGAARNLAGLTP